MKLYATIKNEKGKKEGVGDDTFIFVELSYGNKIVGEVGLFAIKDVNVEGYRIIFNDPDKGWNPRNVIKEIEKAKKQKGEKISIEDEAEGITYGEHLEDIK